MATSTWYPHEKVVGEKRVVVLHRSTDGAAFCDPAIAVDMASARSNQDAVKDGMSFCRKCQYIERDRGR